MEPYRESPQQTLEIQLEELMGCHDQENINGKCGNTVCNIQSINDTVIVSIPGTHYVICRDKLTVFKTNDTLASIMQRVQRDDTSLDIDLIMELCDLLATFEKKQPEINLPNYPKSNQNSQ